MKSVVIIGGGVIGLSAAWALHKRGAKVTVLDAGPGDQGASFVNAGWICPSLSDPVPSPGLIGTSLKWMLNSDSPLYIKPSLDADFLKWLFHFWRACNTRAYLAGTEAVAAFNQRTFALFDEMRADGVAFEMRQDGILYVYYSPMALERQLRDLEALKPFGIIPGKPLWGDDVRRLEPALSNQINGGFWFERERSVTPGELTAALSAWLSKRGVRILRQTTVSGFESTGGTVTAVRTNAGDLRADAFLIAAGARSGELAGLAGRRLPIQGGKGYCLDYAEPPATVSRPIDFAESSFVCTPMNGFTRLAGTMEFSGINQTIRRERVAAIARGAAKGFTGWPSDPGLATVGSGLRPMAPDGLPVIGWLPSTRNVAVATGHGMLGLTLAAATAEAVADLITTGSAPAVIEPFSPARFH